MIAALWLLTVAAVIFAAQPFAAWWRSSGRTLDALTADDRDLDGNVIAFDRQGVRR